MFALIYTVGAWSAWRKNPMYSARLTLRLVAVILFGVAALFAAAFAAANLTENSPAPVTAAAIGGVCFFGGLAFIWLIIQFSIPAPPALPAATKLTRVNRVKLLPWARRFGWATAGIAVLAVAIPGTAKFAVYSVGGLTILLGIVMLFTAYIVARHFDRSLTSVESDPWVHWRYTPQEWKAWSAAEVGRIEAETPRWQWRRNSVALAISLIAISIPFWINVNPADWKWLTALTAFSWLTIVGLVAGVDMYAKTAPYRMRRLLANTAPDTYFGAGGIYSDGVYTEWKTIGNYLLSGTVDEREPRSLTFVFVRSVSGGGTIEVRQSVLMPTGAEADLARLQTAISAMCPTATVALT
jgi:hypothetical protein